jgi:hypothetical protein
MPTIIDWPESLRPATVEWGLFFPQAEGRSAFDGSTQAGTMGAPRWFFTATTGVMKGSEVPEWEAFIGRLRGKVNRARVWDWRREAPIGVATGTPNVRVAGSGSSLALQGWTPSISGILRAGSYMGINGELKRLSVTADSDIDGRCTVQFEPPMRFQASVSTPIELIKPTAKFVMTSERPAFSQQGARHAGATFTFEEDVTP